MNALNIDPPFDEYHFIDIDQNKHAALQEIAGNRKNVFIRDGGQCQYCGKKVTLNSFTFDHVIPRCRGGRSVWENIVVSCLRCNGQKGRKSAKDYHRALLRQPYAPRLTKAAPTYLVNKINTEITIDSWRDFIYWQVVLEK